MCIGWPGSVNSKPHYPAPIMSVVVIPAGTLLSDQDGEDVPHTLLAGITRMDICHNCTKELHPVFPDHNSVIDIQRVDALPITFDGGYGMFYDDIDNNILCLILCKDCALKLFEALPNLKPFFLSNHFDNIQEIET